MLWLIAIPIFGWIVLGITIVLRSRLLQNPTDAARSAFNQARTKVMAEKILGTFQLLLKAPKEPTN